MFHKVPRLYVALTICHETAGDSDEFPHQGRQSFDQGENPMRKQTTFLSAAALLLCSVATASAATAMHGTDTVILSALQRKAVWNDLSKLATNQNASGFNAKIGTFVPSSVKIEPMPSKATANIPSLRPYDYAMVDHKLVIVDPSNKVIADVLTK
jgi:Protein of unknown function (DUF1236)